MRYAANSLFNVFGRPRFPPAAAALVALFLLGIGTAEAGTPDCDSLATNYPGEGGAYQLLDTESGINLFLPTTCGPLYESEPDALYTGDLTHFFVTAGNTYTWSTCGLVDFDSYIRLWEDDVAQIYPLLAQNDDDPNCTSDSTHSTLQWTATFTGAVWLSVNEYLCNAANTLPYQMDARCLPPCLPGDCNLSGGFDAGDPICSVLCLIGEPPALSECECAADCNCSGGADAGDPVCSVRRLIGSFTPDTCDNP